MSVAAPLVQLRSLSKRFGKRPAVAPLNLDVPAGSVFGLLGHNGAGKSTTLGMILGQVFPDAGSVTIAGHDVFAARDHALRHVGAIFESPCFYDYLSGWRNLRLLTSFSTPVSRAQLEQTVELVGLTARIHDKVGTYSHGMRQRLALAQALLPEPRLLLLDEPNDGLDPQGIHETRQLIARLNRERGITILFSSHLLHEVEQVCTHVAVMRAGELLFAGPWSQVDDCAGWLEIDVTPREPALVLLRTQGLIDRVQDGRIHLTQDDPEAASRVARLLVERGYALHALSPRRESLEAFYLRLLEAAPAPTQEATS